MFDAFKKWRRRRFDKEPFPPAWLRILQDRVRYYRLLSSEEQTDLRRLIRVFLAEKRFEGCGGLEITDEIRVTIAAQACILLLNREHDYYSGLHSVLVYPSWYVAPAQFVDPVGVVHEGEQSRLGEAWLRGSIVLAWDEVRQDARDFQDGYNVTFHEFAHQLDQQDGSFDGAPILEKSSHYRSWARVLRKEYDALTRAAERGQETLIDQYGATDPAEFFAVVTEAFFEMPRALNEEHPELYSELKKFYRQDTLARLEKAERR
ncbi:MAG TPA: M90 family metallopeptidase [Chthoniobacterales bacterium]|nr:M90 family metallopeptidase [Chthoniobacterales bacterium]